MVSEAAQIYGGDEVGAFVLDPGLFSTSAGFAGEDAPRFIVPSYYGYSHAKKGDQIEPELDYASASYKDFKKRDYTYYGEESLHIARPSTDIRPIVKDEVIQDWDACIEMFDHLFRQCMVDVSEQPMFLTEPIWNTRANRLKSLEVFLEFFQTPAFYMGKIPACIAFGAGRPNSLIVDIGHDVTSVTPVLDGMCLSKSTTKTHYAGRFLDAQLTHALFKRGITVVPKFQVAKRVPAKYTLEQFKNKEKVVQEYTPKNTENMTELFCDFERMRVLTEMKESLICVPETPVLDASKFDYQSRFFELPTGLQVEFEAERYDIANSLFEPRSFMEESAQVPELQEWSVPENGDMAELEVNNDYVPLKRGKKKDAAEDEEDSTASTPAPGSSKDAKIAGLSSLINKTLANVDVDFRQQMAHNIVVTGLTSFVPGLTERLNKDLSESNPGLKIRLHASGIAYERKYQAWLGASILSSLGIFHQLWVSKQEYEEVGGERLIVERFR